MADAVAPPPIPGVPDHTTPLPDATLSPRGLLGGGSMRKVPKSRGSPKGSPRGSPRGSPKAKGSSANLLLSTLKGSSASLKGGKAVGNPSLTMRMMAKTKVLAARARARKRGSLNVGADLGWQEERRRQLLIAELFRTIGRLETHFHRLQTAYAEAQDDLDQQLHDAQAVEAAERKRREDMRRRMKSMRQQLALSERAVRRCWSAEERWRGLESTIERRMRECMFTETRRRSQLTSWEDMEYCEVLALVAEHPEQQGRLYRVLGEEMEACVFREAAQRHATAAEADDTIACTRLLWAQHLLQWGALDANERQQRAAVKDSEAAAWAAAFDRRRMRRRRERVAAEAEFRRRNLAWLEDTAQWRWSPGRDVCAPPSTATDPRADALCCWPCQIARQDAAVDGLPGDLWWESESWWLCAASVCLCVVPYIGPGCLVLSTRRAMRREFFITGGSGAADAAAALCCWPAVLCQHWRELRLRGRDPGGCFTAPGDELSRDAIPFGVPYPSAQAHGRQRYLVVPASASPHDGGDGGELPPDGELEAGLPCLGGSTRWVARGATPPQGWAAEMEPVDDEAGREGERRRYGKDFLTESEFEARYRKDTGRFFKEEELHEAWGNAMQEAPGSPRGRSPGSASPPGSAGSPGRRPPRGAAPSLAVDAAQGRANLRRAEELDRLGAQLHDKGHCADALAAWRECLALEQQALPAGHPNIGASHGNIGAVLADTGDHAAALVEYRAALRIKQRALPAGHPDIAALHDSIADVLEASGDHAGALAEHRAAMDARQTPQPAGRPDVAVPPSNRGRGSPPRSRGARSPGLAAASPQRSAPRSPSPGPQVEDML